MCRTSVSFTTAWEAQESMQRSPGHGGCTQSKHGGSMARLTGINAPTTSELILREPCRIPPGPNRAPGRAVTPLPRRQHLLGCLGVHY